MPNEKTKAKKKTIDRFVSPSLAAKYPDHRKAGSSLNGLQLRQVELVCELNELRELLTSSWMVALSTRRADPDQPVKLTIITEIPA